jgi:hypothetical protein
MHVLPQGFHRIRHDCRFFNDLQADRPSVPSSVPPSRSRSRPLREWFRVRIAVDFLGHEVTPLAVRTVPLAWPISGAPLRPP